MSITLNFELNDQDLAHFQAAAESSRKAAEGKSEQEVMPAIAAAQARLAARPDLMAIIGPALQGMENDL